MDRRTDIPYNATISWVAEDDSRPGGVAVMANPDELGRILIVEDDPAVRETLDAILSADYTVDAVSSLAEARAALGRARYEAVVTDFSLGDGTGQAVIEAAARLCPGAFVILLTGDIGRSDVRALNRSGQVLVLLKPINPEELISWLKNGVMQARLSARRREIVARSGNTPSPSRRLEKAPTSTPGGQT